jgi:hypothetical protein
MTIVCNYSITPGKNVIFERSLVAFGLNKKQEHRATTVRAKVPICKRECTAPL